MSLDILYELVRCPVNQMIIDFLYELSVDSILVAPEYDTEKTQPRTFPLSPPTSTSSSSSSSTINSPPCSQNQKIEESFSEHKQPQTQTPTTQESQQNKQCIQSKQCIQNDKCVQNKPQAPEIPRLKAFIQTLLRQSNAQTTTLLATMVYLRRLKQRLPTAAKGKPCTRHRIFLASLILAAKYVNDASPKNKHWAKYSKIFSLVEVNMMEQQFVFLLNWDVSIQIEDLLWTLKPLMARMTLACKDTNLTQTSNPTPTVVASSSETISPCPSAPPQQPQQKQPDAPLILSPSSKVSSSSTSSGATQGPLLSQDSFQEVARSVQGTINPLDPSGLTGTMAQETTKDVGQPLLMNAEITQTRKRNRADDDSGLDAQIETYKTENTSHFKTDSISDSITITDSSTAIRPQNAISNLSSNVCASTTQSLTNPMNAHISISSLNFVNNASRNTSEGEKPLNNMPGPNPNQQSQNQNQTQPFITRRRTLCVPNHVCCPQHMYGNIRCSTDLILSSLSPHKSILSATDPCTIPQMPPLFVSPSKRHHHTHNQNHKHYTTFAAPDSVSNLNSNPSSQRQPLKNVFANTNSMNFSYNNTYPPKGGDFTRDLKSGAHLDFSRDMKNFSVPRHGSLTLTHSASLSTLSTISSCSSSDSSQCSGANCLHMHHHGPASYTPPPPFHSLQSMSTTSMSSPTNIPHQNACNIMGHAPSAPEIRNMICTEKYINQPLWKYSMVNDLRLPAKAAL